MEKQAYSQNFQRVSLKINIILGRIVPLVEIPTIGVNIVKEPITIKDDKENDRNAILLLWDVAGQIQFQMLHKPYFNGSNGMLIVFDTTRLKTFENVKNWYETTQKHGLGAIPRIVIGNKIDLEDERKVTSEMATRLSHEIGAPFFETSAKEGENVKLVFEEITRRILKAQTKSLKFF